MSDADRMSGKEEGGGRTGALIGGVVIIGPTAEFDFDKKTWRVCMVAITARLKIKELRHKGSFTLRHVFVLRGIKCQRALTLLLQLCVLVSIITEG